MKIKTGGMMRSNHRIIQMFSHDQEPWVEIRLTHYNADGSIMAFSDPFLFAECPARMQVVVEEILSDITTNPELLTLDMAIGPKDSEEVAF